MCGVNDLNQLGLEGGTKTNDHIYKKDDIFDNKCFDVVKPTIVECFIKMKVRKISCGESHCLALVDDDISKIQTVWSWGSNRFGQLGQGVQLSKSLPKPINYLLGYNIVEVI